MPYQDEYFNDEGAVAGVTAPLLDEPLFGLERTDTPATDDQRPSVNAKDTNTAALSPSALQVLTLDDDPQFHQLMDFMLRGLGYHTLCCETYEQAEAQIRQHCPQMMLLDWQLHSISGLDLIESLQALQPTMPIILTTAHSSTEVAVDAMKRGAFDFLPKPIDEARLITVLARAAQHHHLLQIFHADDSLDDIEFEGIIGQCPAIQALKQRIAHVAPTDASVMIQGESGTGKELVARAIHRRSRRSSEPFVAINMAAIPKELVESTLFGHEKGSFTGAESKRIGAVEEADGGTLFLDEIGEMPIELQSKLLRFIQERTFRRVGSTMDHKCDVRLVSATNREPHVEIAAKRMREDLYYRLNVVPIILPPLRERGEDVVLLSTVFLKQLSEKYDKDFEQLSADAAEAMAGYSWPGNVRQLLHAMEQIVVLHQGPTVERAMLPPEVLKESPGSVLMPPPVTPASVGPEPISPEVPAADLPSKPSAMDSVEPPVDEVPDESVAFRDNAIVPMAEMERLAIEHALAVCDGSIRTAARRLQISEATMYRKLKIYRETE